MRVPEQASGGRRSDVLCVACAAGRVARARRFDVTTHRGSIICRCSRTRHGCRRRQLDRNNRILIAQGLQRIRQGRLRPGIAAYFQIAGKDARARVRAISVSRLDRASTRGAPDRHDGGIECLITDSFERAIELARQLDQLNRDRREFESDMQLDALAVLDDSRRSARSTICLYDEDWHQGVIGLVRRGSRKSITDRRSRLHAPATASCADPAARSTACTCRHARLVTKHAPTLVRRFGGHAMAAGLTMPASSYDGFVSAFEDATRASCDRALFERTITTDGALAANEVVLSLIEAIDSHVWGQGFPAPLFDNEFVVVEQRLVKDRHLKLVLDLDGRLFDAVWFSHTEQVPRTVRLAYRPVVDEYMGERRLQLMIEHAAL